MLQMHRCLTAAWWLLRLFRCFVSVLVYFVCVWCGPGVREEVLCVRFGVVFCGVLFQSCNCYGCFEHSGGVCAVCCWLWMLAYVHCMHIAIIAHGRLWSNMLASVCNKPHEQVHFCFMMHLCAWCLRAASCRCQLSPITECHHMLCRYARHLQIWQLHHCLITCWLCAAGIRSATAAQHTYC
jgi:hypothetical protein